MGVVINISKSSVSKNIYTESYSSDPQMSADMGL